MDDYEKEYFNKLEQIASDYQGRRRDLAKSRIKMFVAALYRQLFEENEKFDLLVTAGNSGLYMAAITMMVYQSLGVRTPHIVTLPIYRFKSDKGKVRLNDNSLLKSILRGRVKNLPQEANILFVDDEIMQGLTVKAALDLIFSELPNLVSIRCVIVAENHFFEWHFKMSKVSINYFAYSRLIQGLNGNIGYFIPEDLYSQITSHLADVESHNHAMAIVIGGALKRKGDNRIPFYDTKVEEVCQQNIPGYQKIKESLISELEELVHVAIKEYKDKTVQFRF